MQESYSTEYYIVFLFPNSLRAPARLAKLVLLPNGSLV